MINEDDLRQSLKLYLVTDSDILKERDFYDCIEKAILGGVTTVQLREKEASGKEFLEKAIKLREITKKHNVNFICTFPISYYIYFSCCNNNTF